MPPPWIKHEKILETHTRALEIGLHQKRDLLLSGLPIQYVATLADSTSPSNQLLADLTAMNDCPRIVGGIVPIEVWYTNAAHHAALFTEHKEFFTNTSDEIADAAHADQAGQENLALENADAQFSGIDFDTVQERLIFTNDLLPIGFLSQASMVGKSVCRLIVTRHEGGQPVTSLTGRPKRYFGTGWLIGKSHVITNHHVVNARDPTEPDAIDQDLNVQSEKTEVQFDFDVEGAVPEKGTVAELIHVSKPLDYAILQLNEELGRAKLSLWPKAVSLPSADVVPLNIIQHPGGAPKQIGMRNNLAANINENELAYFTDTQGGSSGSPVCNDLWQVVALHKASTRTFGEHEFQGKKTRWVNVGTRIDKIIADLESKNLLDAVTS